MRTGGRVLRMILVPLGGEPRDRAALAAARRIDGPSRARITGLFARPDMVEALAMLQGSGWTGAARAAGKLVGRFGGACQAGVRRSPAPAPRSPTGRPGRTR
jgi:hypothetical protein